MGVPTEGGDAYLQLRFEKLAERERVVNLLIDEVYVKKQVEYVNGEITGLSPNSTPASTVLCFMVPLEADCRIRCLCWTPVEYLEWAHTDNWLAQVGRLAESDRNRRRHPAALFGECSRIRIENEKKIQ